MANWTVPESVAFVLFVRRTLATACVAFVLWLAVAFALFCSFPDSSARRTDAVIMLGGASTERLPQAEELRASLDIPVLVISHSNTPGNASADALCQDGTVRPEWLICLELDKKDTRGEARAIGTLVEARGWNSITVVTSRYHMARAGGLVRQCAAAQVDMFGSSPELGPKQWLDRFVIESGGLLDVMMRPECVQETANKGTIDPGAR